MAGSAGLGLTSPSLQIWRSMSWDCERSPIERANRSINKVARERDGSCERPSPVMSMCMRVHLVGLVVLSGFLATTGCDSDFRHEASPQARERPSVVVGSGRSGAVRAMVQNFMKRRVAGRGAEKFLDSDGRNVFRERGTLGALYPEPPPLEDFKVVFVDDLGDATYEVGVRLIFARGTYGDTLFVHAEDGRFIVSGGRPGLTGP